MVNSHWVSAVAGLHYLKQGLECFCNYVVKHQHDRLIETFCPGACDQCELETVTPAHSCKAENSRRICPLRQIKCNCLKSNNALRKCPKDTCGIIYDEIIRNHASTPPSPNWNNTDIKQWYNDPWAIATCYIKARGYAGRKGAAKFDCSGLLSVIINSKAFHGYLDCDIDGDDAFSKVIQMRNKLFHSPSQEIEEKKAHRYIDCMIEVLGKVKYADESRDDAMEKLNNLKKEGIWMDVGMRNSVIENDQKKMDFLVEKIAEHEDKLEVLHERVAKKQILEADEIDQRDKLMRLVSRFKSLESKVASINEDEAENATNFSEIRSGVEDAIESGKHTLALSLLVVWAGGIDSVKKQENKENQNEMPILSRPHDGRLITLNEKQINGLLGNCEKHVLKGGFGLVHVSTKKVPGLDVRVVIKKIVVEGEEEKIKMLSISNEKIASRIMHFAIVPLIAYMNKRLGQNKRAFYFLSPFLERGNLLDAIAKDKQCVHVEDIQLKCPKRIEVLFQIASALDYLHTPVPNNRGTVLHMDLTSRNIVLDNALNARIIDFGLAREMNEGQTKVTYTESKCFGTPGYYPTVKYSSLTVHEDYYNFGVVIREVLTGRQPYFKGGDDVSELRKLEERSIMKLFQGNIWPKRSAQALAELSTQCLTRRQNNFSSAEILKILEKQHSHQTEFTGPHENKCDLCMVNVAVTGARSLTHRCRMKVCVSCMRDSHVNPIKCPICNEYVIPNIGHSFAALLIAGNDIKEEGLAKSFKDDVDEIKEVLVSKCPCVVGIREENVRIVAPSVPGKPEILIPHFNRAVNELKSKKNLKTLFLYFTGHHSTTSGFELGSPEDILTLEKLQEGLKKMSTIWGKQTRILVFLDCCQPPSVAGPRELSNKFIKIAQVNACRPEEVSEQPINGSVFQKFFIQALTRKSFNKQCYNTISEHGMSDTTCRDCKISGDFISVQQLLEYIGEHMANSWSGKQPIMYTNDITWLDAGIGYNIDFVINLELKFEGPEPTRDIKLSHKIFYDIKEVRKSILEKVIETADFDKQTEIKLTPVEFADAIALRIQTGSQGSLELHSMLNVSSAMNGKREIVASYRTVLNIHNGKVVVFVPTERISRYLDSQHLVENTDEGRKIVTLSLLDLDHVTNEIKEIKDLEEIHMILLKVDQKWRHGKNKESKELKVIFPCINSDKYHDFMVLDLSVKAGNSMQLFKKMANSLQKRKMSLLLSVLVLIIAAILVFLFDTKSNL